MGKEVTPPVDPNRYDQIYFLTSCEGYAEFINSEGANLSRRLKQAFDVAEIAPGMAVLDVGCGRGEVMRRCADLGAHAYGIDYAPVAVRMARELRSTSEEHLSRPFGIFQADAKCVPFSDHVFDRVLMFDLVEHLWPWELEQAIAEAKRVLRPDGRLIIHTAPNIWYDRYAYPVVRWVRTVLGDGSRYPKNPRAVVPANLDVHVNEQSAWSLYRLLKRSGFRVKTWLDSPPQTRNEGWVLGTARYVLFHWPPFHWFFQREVFAVAYLDDLDQMSG